MRLSSIIFVICHCGCVLLSPQAFAGSKIIPAWCAQVPSYYRKIFSKSNPHEATASSAPDAGVAHTLLPVAHPSLPQRIPMSIQKQLNAQDYFLARREALKIGRIDLANAIDTQLESKLIHTPAAEIKLFPQEHETFSIKGEALVDEHFTPGTSESYQVKFQTESGEDLQGIFKPHGSLSNTQAETAAYEIEKKLGMGLVPVTVERELSINGKPVKGSLQYWVSHYPKESKAKTELIEFFDSLIGNNDRTNNILRGSVAIDHGHAFRFKQNVYVITPPPSVAQAFRAISEPEYAALLSKLPDELKSQALARRREILFLLDHPEYKVSQNMGLAGRIGLTMNRDSGFQINSATRDKALQVLTDLNVDYALAAENATRVLNTSNFKGARYW